MVNIKGYLKKNQWYYKPKWTQPMDDWWFYEHGVKKQDLWVAFLDFPTPVEVTSPLDWSAVS